MGIFDWREKSPFEPMGEHMRQVRACVDLVMPMFECVRDADYTRLTEITVQVFKAEHEADKIKAQIRETIPTRFSLPVYRGDLLAYLHVQDDIADVVEDLAVQLTSRIWNCPPNLSIRCSRWCARYWTSAIGCIRQPISSKRWPKRTSAVREPKRC